MANIFQKIGSAFGQYGMDDRMPADEFLNLPKGDRRQMQIQGLQNFANKMNLVGAQQSGNAQRIAQAQNIISQSQAEDEARQLKAQKEELLASMTPEQRKIYELYGPQAAFDYKYNKPERKTIEGADGYRYYLDGSRVLPNVTAPEEPVKRDSFVAKDGYRYYVDDNTRVFPGVTVTEEQSEEDLYKENAAKIKNTILTKGKDALTENELAFYDDYMKNKGFMNIEQAMASQMFGNNNTNNTNNSNNLNTSNENIVQDGKTYVYSRTQADGSKVYVNGGKEYVFQD